MGDERINNVLYGNFLTSHKNKHILVKKSFEYIKNEPKNYTKWEYGNIKKLCRYYVSKIKLYLQIICIIKN